MDGRKAVAAGLFVLMTGGGCAPWGPLVVAGGIGGAAAEIQASGPGGADVEPPRLGKIFRDGRYEFAPAPASVQRAAERRFRRTPEARRWFRKVTVKLVTNPPGNSPILTYAIVWKKKAAQRERSWEGFVAGYTRTGDAQLTPGTLRGADIASGEQAGAPVVLVDHSDGVTLLVVGAPRASIGPTKDVARYLLRSR